MPSKTAKKPSRFALTPEQRAERIATANSQLAKAVDGLMTAEGWENLIASRHSFRGYSLGNQLMILMQLPEATDVRPLSVWTELIDKRDEDGNLLKAWMKKGTHKIQIRKPVFKRDDEGDDSKLAFFKLVPVVDISQLQDPPAVAQAPRAAELTGNAPEQLWDRVALQILAKGYAVEVGDPGHAGAKGVTMFDKRRVIIREGMSPAQSVKTLIHELAHVACGHEARMHEPRALLEVEAESVACIVASVAGLSTLEYSVPYVASWAENTETVKASATLVLKVADEILAVLGMEAKAQEVEEEAVAA